MAREELAIEELSAARLDELEPIWDALRQHHLAVAPRWLPAAHSREASWRRRRAQYEEWLADGQAFLLVLRRGERAVGYVFVHLRGGSPTWQMADRAGEVETLALLPEERGQGSGLRLLTAVYDRLREVGAREVSLHVLATNVDAARFYDREGFKPFAVWMTRPVPER